MCGCSPHERGETRRPLVAILTPRFLPYSQTFIYDQLAHFERYAPEVFARARMNADRFPFPATCTLTPGGPRRHVEALRHRITGFSPTFLARLREGGHCLLHAQFGRAGLFALSYQAALRVPLVVTFRGHDVALIARNRGFPHPWRGRQRARLFASTARFLAVSGDLARRLVAIGAPAERVHVCYGGVAIPPPAEPATRSGPLRLLMAGRFVEKKGFEYGIEAFARLLAAGVDARLTIAGEGSRGRAYGRLARLVRVADRIEMPGALPHEALLARIAAADIVIVPSVSAADGDCEGIPNVLKEAGARGVPVVATKHAGLAEALDDGATGLLVEERNAAALAEALRALANDRLWRHRLGLAAREKIAARFDVRRQVAELERHYDVVIEEAARR